MIEPIKWVERKFVLGYSTGYAPFFIERLKMTAPRIEELFGTCSEEALATKNEGEWSAKEHLGHLIDLEILHDGRIDDFLAGAPSLRAADMDNKRTYAAHHDQRSSMQLLAAFRAARNKFLLRVAGLDVAYYERKSLHPRLQQQMTLTDMLFFVAEHDNHHTMRIARLLA